MTDPTDPASTGAAPKREQAVAALFQAHYPAMKRLAFLLGADDPEDVASEAFCQLVRNWSGLRSTDAGLPWLRSVVRNLTCRRIRRLERERKGVFLLESDPTTAPSVEYEAALQEDQRAVVNALKELPCRQREVLVLRYWGDLSEAEIATTLDIAAGTVKSHASRGMASLERTLEKASVKSTLEKLR